MKTKLIFTTSSLYYFLRLFVFRILLLAVSIYLLIHFSENPILISILLAIVLSIFLFSGQDIIDVYEDRFVYRSTSFFKRVKGNREFMFSDLSSISYDGMGKAKLDEKIAFVVLQLFINQRKNNFPNISIERKNGGSEKLILDIYRQDIAKAVSIINEKI